MPNITLRFANLLAGHYSNFAQSQRDPVNFAHINIYFRPLPWKIFQGPGFYSEQSYGHDPWQPYRQGVHRLISTDKVQIVENFGFDQPIRLAGAGFTPKLLNLIHIDRLKQRCGCAMHFQETTPGCFSGKVEPGQKCLVPRDGRPTYLVSEVLLDRENWISRDRGFDPATNTVLWGSEHGPLRFERVASFESEVTAEWARLSNDKGERSEQIE